MIPLTFQELTNLVVKNVDECWKDPGPNDPEKDPGPNDPQNWFCFRSNNNETMYACDGDSGGPIMVMRNNADGKQR